MNKIKKIPTLVGMIVLLLATFVGVFFLNSQQVFKIGASPEKTPRDVRISNIGSTTLTVSWITDIESVGYVLYGQSKSSTTSVVSETDSSDNSITHHVTITGLSPNTDYYFKINSNAESFDNSGTPWQVKTLNQTQENLTQFNVSGNVLSASGKPVNHALVYINSGGKIFSTTTSQTGNFIAQVSIPGIESLDKIPLEIFVQEDTNNVSTVQAIAKSANPLSPIIIGQTHDFRNTNNSINASEPDADLLLPENVQKGSRFVIPSSTDTPSMPAVTLKSLDEGETITSTTPEFSGDGPKGETFTILVESENPISDSVKISNNGSWKWSVPEGLAEGVHKITISWKENGITKQLTKNFIVQAGELPAFEATPSETLKTATPTATSKATTKPTTTAKATATASAKPVPETGTLTGTLILSIMGILSIAVAIYGYKLSILKDEQQS